MTSRGSCWSSARVLPSTGASARCLLGSEWPTLRVDVMANGQLLGSVDYDHESPCPSTTRLSLPADAEGDSGEMLVAWQVHSPRSPNELGLSKDNRPLGLFVERVTILSLA